jgi:branched-chain amino acid transport system permease protein
MFEGIDFLIFVALNLSSIYILTALGLTLVFGVMGIPNFAHGALYAVGAFVTYSLITAVGLPYPVAIVGSMLVMGVIGMGLERGLFRPFQHKITASFMIALALATILSNSILLIWGHWPKVVPSPFMDQVSIGSFTVVLQRVIIIGVTLAAGFFFYLFLMKTKMGASIRGVAQDRDAAALVGVRIQTARYLTLGVGTSLAALASSLIGPITSIFPTMGDTLILKAFAVSLIGGMGSASGAVVGGLIVGFVEAFVGTYVSSFWKDAITFVMLIVFLLVKPGGILGHK